MTNSSRQRRFSIKDGQPMQDEPGSRRRSAQDRASPKPSRDTLEIHDERRGDPPHIPGFLGSTSYSAVFTEGESSISLKEQEKSPEVDYYDRNSLRLPRYGPTKIQEGAEVLSRLGEMSIYGPVLTKRYALQSLEALAPFVPDCIALIPENFAEKCRGKEFLTRLSYETFEQTSTLIPMESDLKFKDYPSFLMGDNMGWEIVGLMLTAAGIAAMSVYEINAFDEADLHIDWKKHAQDMVRAGDQCISFCECFGHLNDIGISLIFLNFILHTQVYGDAGKYRARRINCKWAFDRS